MAYVIHRLPGVLAKTGDRRATWYQKIRKGLAPKPIALGARARGWPDDELDALNRARISGASDSEIMQLVKDLEAARKQLVREVSYGDA